jgi:XTP/dITP diphosphohydrolase
MKLCFVTNNANKVQEITTALGDQFDILTLSQIGFTEDIPETEETLEGNSELKARHIYDRFHLDCFADDTGLEVDALNGAPGVYSARYAGEKADAEKNIDKLIAELEGTTDRNAQFRTIITLLLHGEKHQFVGEVKGTISEKRMGEKGFGYDPVFVPEGYDISFAQMSMEEKNVISHRGKAVRKLIEFLNSLDTSAPQ